MANSIHVDGVDLGASSYGLYVSSVRWPFLPQPRVYSENLAQADGTVTQGSTYGARYVSADCAIKGDDFDDMTSKARAVAAILSRFQLGEKSIKFDVYDDRVYYGRLVSGFEAELAGAGCLFTLEFEIPYPWAEATSETSDDETISGDSTFYVVEGGDIDSEPVWVIKNGPVAASSVTLQNETTGEVITVSLELPANAWLRLTRGTLAAELSTDSGSNWSSVAANITGLIPRLSGGVTNTLNLYGLTSGTVEYAYTERYRA